MEIISLAGYTEMEKLHIAAKYLVPRQREENGLAEGALTIGEPTLRTLIHHYTKESGVRSLEREIASLCRKAARRVVAEGPDTTIEVLPNDLPKLLGPTKYRSNKMDERDELGVVNGLSVTSYGGELLVAEVAVVPGKGKLLTTGKLGDVMQESAQAALSYVRSRAHALGLAPDFHTKVDIHVHFPEGAIPKDGPSAGIAIATCLVSALTKKLVHRDVAMTGEITLRGRVLPIGGLKEKMMAAHRAGMTTVIAPKENRRDLRDVPGAVLRGLRVVLVEHADDVLREALVLDDRDAFMPPARAIVEYRAGKLVEAAPVVPAPRDTGRRSRPIP
jgi:ATP-dependent Lon protease